MPAAKGLRGDNAFTKLCNFLLVLFILRLNCGSLRVVMACCGSLWLIVACGSLQLVVVCCDLLWLVVGGCGSLRLVVVRFGSLWFVVVRCGSLRSLSEHLMITSY